MKATQEQAINLAHQLFEVESELRERKLNDELRALEQAREQELSEENDAANALRELEEKERQEKIERLKQEIKDAESAGDEILKVEKQRELDRLVLTAEARQKENEINARFDEQVREKKREAFEAGKRAAIIQATIDGVLAVMKTMASLPFPANLVPAGLQLAATAAQIALISSQPVPAFQAGGVAPGGLALVGEAGPELANLPAGTRIFNNQETNEIMKSSFNIENLNLPSVQDPEGFFEAMQNYQREQGTLAEA